MFHINLTQQQYAFMFNVFHIYLCENLPIFSLSLKVSITRWRVNSHCGWIGWADFDSSRLKLSLLLLVISFCNIKQEEIICYIRKEEIVHKYSDLNHEDRAWRRHRAPSLLTCSFDCFLLHLQYCTHQNKYTHTHIQIHSKTHMQMHESF